MSLLDAVVEPQDDTLTSVNRVSEDTIYQQQVAQEGQNEMSGWEQFKAVADLDHAGPALGRALGMAAIDSDPDWKLPEGQAFEDLIAGIHTENIHAFDAATSETQAKMIRYRLLHEQELEQKMASQGWGGLGVRLVGNMLDPSALALGIVTGPLAVSTKATRLQNAMRAAGLVAAENMALETAVMAGSPSRDWEDVAYAGLIGAALGFPIGALHRGKVSGLSEEAAGAMGRAMDEADNRALESVGFKPEEIREARTNKAEQELEATIEEIKPPREQHEELIQWKQLGQTARDNIKSVREQQAKVQAEHVRTMDIMRKHVDEMEDVKAALARASDELEEAKDYVREAGDDVEVDTVTMVRPEAEIRAEMDALTEQLYKISQKMDTADQKIIKMDEKLARYDESLKKLEKKYQKSVGKRKQILKKLRDAKLEAERPDDSVGAARNKFWDEALVNNSEEDDFTPEQLNAVRSFADKARFSVSAQGSRFKNPLYRWTFGKLFDDAVGKADGSVNETAASARAHQLSHVYRTKFYRAYSIPFQKYAKTNRWNIFKRQQEWNKFGEDVAKYIRGELDEVPAEVKEAAQGIRKLYAEILREAKKSGVKEFVDIPENGNYVPRIFDLQKVHELRAKYKEQMVDLLAGAIRAARDDIDPQVARKIAKGYWEGLRKLTAGIDMTPGRALAKDNKEWLHKAMTDAGVDKDEAEGIILQLHKDDAPSGSPRAKYRTDLDETFSMELKDINGNAETVRFSDLLNSDIEQVTMGYIRQMAGRTALAKTDPTIFGSKDLMDAWMKRTASYAEHNGLDRAEIEKANQLMEWGWKAITGVPLEEGLDKGGKQFMRWVSDYNFVRIMNQVGFAQLAEIGNLLAMGGWKQTIRHIPEITNIARRSADGTLDDDLQEELELLLGTGADWLINPASAKFDDYGMGMDNKFLNTTHDLMQNAKRVTSGISGMAAVNTVLHRMTSRVLAQRFYDAAMGKKGIDAPRLKQAGLSDEMYERILETMRSSKVDSVPSQFFDTKKITRLNVSDWEPDVADAFTQALGKLARIVIQENDIGATHQLMHTAVGKLLFQFRTFMLGAYEKQFLHNIAMGKEGASTTIGAWTGGMIFGALAYILQTHANALYRDDREEFLEKRLGDDRLFFAAFQRAGFSSLLPMTVDTATYLTGFEPLFSARSTGLATGAILGNPTVDLGMKALGSVRGAVAPWNPVTDYQYSQEDWRAQTSILPFSNALMINEALKQIGQSTFPKRSQ